MPNKHTRKASARKLATGSGTRYYGKSGASNVTRSGANTAGEGAPQVPVPVVPPSASLSLSTGPETSEPPASATMPMLAVGAAGGSLAAVGRSRRPWSAGRVFRWSLVVVGFLALGLGGYGIFLVVKLQGAIYAPLPATPTAVAEVMPTQPTALPGQPTPTLLPSPTVNHVRDLPAGRFNILCWALISARTIQIILRAATQ